MKRSSACGIASLFALLPALIFGQSRADTLPAPRSPASVINSALCEVAARPERFNEEMIRRCFLSHCSGFCSGSFKVSSDRLVNCQLFTLAGAFYANGSSSVRERAHHGPRDG